MKGNLKSDNIAALFFKYLIPSVGGTLAYGVLIFIDTVFIGRGIGSLGLAALNLSLPVYTLVAFGMMLGMGGATAASIDQGKGDFKKRNQTFSLSVFLGIALSIVLSIILSLNLEWICRILGAEGETYELTYDYLNVITKTLILYIMPHVISSFIRNDKNPKLTMINLLVCAFFNIILDYLFIFVFKWGMSGAALATGIAQFMGLMTLLTHFKMPQNTLKYVKTKIDFTIIKRIITIGGSSFINEIAMGTIIFLFNYMFNKYLGENGIASYGIILNINLLIYLVFSGISQGAQPILSINYGAGLYTRVRETLRLGIKVSLVCGIFFYISLLIFRDPVILLFTRNNPAILEITKVGFPIFFLGSIFTGLNLALGGFFQSIGNGKIASIINIMRGFVLIALGLLILPKLFGVIGIWSAYLVCEVLTFILATVYYKKFFKKKNLSL